jgi:transcription antitermination protein NusB
MKTATDPRHRNRIKIVKYIFSHSFRNHKSSNPQIRDIMKNLPQIDKLISVAAPEWPIDKISKIDLAILRLALYELQITGNTPPKVIIDEAVELAKEFGGENSPSFVNGVLGTVIKSI